MVENEIHFLCECKNDDTLRLKMFDSIYDSDFVLTIDHKKTFITLMRSTDKKITKSYQILYMIVKLHKTYICLLTPNHSPILLHHYSQMF